MAIARPLPAHAEDWQSYSPTTYVVHEMDKDSVRVVDGLVHFRYRERLPSSGDRRGFDRPLEAVADCGRRLRSDLTKAPLALRPVFENTQSADQVDFACAAAGLPSTKPPPPSDGATRDWRRRAGAAVDANSVKVRDGLVQVEVEVASTAWTDAGVATRVIDCARRRIADAAGPARPLVSIDEFGSPALAELACELARVPLKPASRPKAVDVDAPLVDVRQVRRDDELYEIDLSKLELRDGLVHFTYRQHFLADGTVLRSGKLVHAVVDCSGRRRSDETDGQFDLRAVKPHTRGSHQLDRVCDQVLPGNASAAGDRAHPGDAASASPGAAACRYVRAESTPAHWRGSRLRVDGASTACPCR